MYQPWRNQFNYPSTRLYHSPLFKDMYKSWQAQFNDTSTRLCHSPICKGMYKHGKIILSILPQGYTLI